jgi:hypothetical protein
MERRRLLIIGRWLTLNILISWVILPFALPPFQGYTLTQLGEVVLWQVMGTIGWPFVLVGALLSILFSGEAADLGPLLLVLMYPAMLFFLIRVIASKVRRRWELPLLHLLLALSFTAIWYHVLNGYDFMVG